MTDLEALREALARHSESSWTPKYAAVLADAARRYLHLMETGEKVRALVEEQAEDEGLWFMARTAPEAYLQQELRRLHALIEGDGKYLYDFAADKPGRER